VSSLEYNVTEYKITLPSNLLIQGSNKVDISFSTPYNRDGRGFHSFLDKQDNTQYIYTKFEPAYCHYVIPSFDQPDIKAHMKLRAIVSDSWLTISNEPEIKSASGDASIALLARIAEKMDLKEWSSLINPKYFEYKETERISTYLFAIVAGPFAYQEENVEGYPPMRIYARASIKGLDHKEKFMVTRVGMKFYEDLFGLPYPFKKYDQLFVPEFSSGAMENVGCVTFNEKALYVG
jgi:aminopeptidase N